MTDLAFPNKPVRESPGISHFPPFYLAFSFLTPMPAGPSRHCSLNTLPFFFFFSKSSAIDIISTSERHLSLSLSLSIHDCPDPTVRGGGKGFEFTFLRSYENWPVPRIQNIFLEFNFFLYIYI